MKVQIMHQRCVTYVTYISFERGLFKINWATSQIEFSTKKLRNLDKFCKSKQYMLDMRDFKEIPDVKAKMVHNCCTLDTLYDTYVLDYIEGCFSLPLKLSDADEEVYLSALPPFDGKFSYQVPKTFSGKFFILKRISK